MTWQTDWAEACAKARSVYDIPSAFPCPRRGPKVPEVPARLNDQRRKVEVFDK